MTIWQHVCSFHLTRVTNRIWLVAIFFFKEAGLGSSAWWSTHGAIFCSNRILVKKKFTFELNQKQIKYLRAVAFHGILATVNVIPGTGPAAVALRAWSSFSVETPRRINEYSEYSSIPAIHGPAQFRSFFAGFVVVFAVVRHCHSRSEEN